MDNRAIGVCDSGLGGLTAVKEIMRRFPNESIIYFGDTGRVPYGTRSNETVVKYARQDINFLLSFDIKAVVVACGTASSIALPEIGRGFPVPVVGVVEPGARAAARISKKGRVAVIATPGTIRSGAYERALKAIAPEIEVMSIACPLFVPLVEAGRWRRGDIVIETVAGEYLAPVKEFAPDAVILGCTHYPLLSGVISDVLGPDVTLIDVGAQAAEELLSLITPCGEGSRIINRYFVSDNVYNFTHIADMFLEKHIDGHVEKIDIEAY